MARMTTAPNTLVRIDPAQVRRELSVRRARAWPLADFVRAAWHVLEPAEPLVWGRHLDAMCLHLEAVADGRIRRLVINVPPGHMKSLLVRVFFVAWWWLRDPAKRILATTYAERLTIRDSMKLRTLVTSQWYQETFAPSWSLRRDQRTKTQFNTTASGYCTSTSVGGSTTGSRGDVVLVDDPLDVRQGYSDVLRAAANNYMRKTLPTRINNPKTGVFILIMQRLHVDDPSAHAIKRGWVHLCLAARYDPARHCSTSIGWEDWRTEPGELLFPELYDEQSVRELEDELGPDDAPGQLDQRPTSPRGNVIRKDWTKQRYSVLPSECVHRGVWTQSWDVKAGSKDPRSSWVVGQVWCRVGADRYLVDQVRGRWEIDETMDAIERFSAKWPLALEKIIEDKADGKAIVRLLKARVEGLTLHNPGTGDKAARLRSTIPLWTAGNVWFPEELPSASRDNTIDGLLTEVTEVPRAQFDDQADATSQYLNKTIAAGQHRAQQDSIAPSTQTRARAGKMSLKSLVSRTSRRR